MSKKCHTSTLASHPPMLQKLVLRKHKNPIIIRNIVFVPNKITNSLLLNSRMFHIRHFKSDEAIDNRSSNFNSLSKITPSRNTTIKSDIDNCSPYGKSYKARISPIKVKHLDSLNTLLHRPQISRNKKAYNSMSLIKDRKLLDSSKTRYLRITKKDLDESIKWLNYDIKY